MIIREFAQEFEKHAWDVGMAEEGVKTHLVWVVHQDTQTCLGAYGTIHSGDKMARLETVQDRLHCIPYIQMLEYLE